MRDSMKTTNGKVQRIGRAEVASVASERKKRPSVLTLCARFVYIGFERPGQRFMEMNAK
jgi:hypothetical protein